MGATTFNMTATGTDVNKVFNELHEEAIEYYGHNPYSGSIATTSLGHEINVPDKLAKAIKKNDWDTIYEYDSLLFSEKRYTNYTKEISHYNAFSPKWVNDKEVVAREKGVRNITKYELISEKRSRIRGYRSPVVRYDNITEAKKAAKSMALRDGDNVTIKQFRSNGKSFKLGVMQLETDGKEYKSKRTAKTKVYLPVYKFEFYVYAAT